MGGGGRCFLATVAYGSELAPEIHYLSDFRDRVLIHNSYGRVLIKVYNRLGPHLAKFIENRPRLKALTRCVLTQLIKPIRQHSHHRKD